MGNHDHNNGILLASVFRYPVKSLEGEALDDVVLTVGKGVPDDRKWAIATSRNLHKDNGDWVPCSNFERLTIRPAIANWKLARVEEGSPVLENNSGEVLRFDSDGLPAGPIPSPFADAIKLQRAFEGFWDHADATLSIINLNTVEALSDAIGTPIDPLRFRANLYVRAEPWSEFSWLGRSMWFGQLELDVIRPIDRCKATSVNPATGRADVNVPAQLARHFGHIFCGVYARVKKAGVLQTGSYGQVGGFTNLRAVEASSLESTAPKPSTWPRVAEVVELKEEAEGIRSVYLNDPLARITLANYQSAQHIRVHALGRVHAWRAYTVSGVFNKNTLRITVKQDQGTGSKAIHELKVGDKLLISGPDGQLLKPNAGHSLAFITAGIGITPAVAMLRDLVSETKPRPTRVVHVAKSRTNAALWPEVEDLSEQLPCAQASLWTTKTQDGDCFGRPEFSELAVWARKHDATVIMCGPDEFMKSVRRQLLALQITNDRIQSEAFVSPDVDIEFKEPSKPGPYEVYFSHSNIETIWTPDQGTILDLAERHGIVAPSHCRAGQCGTCRAKIRNGSSESLIGIATDDDSMLTCCSVPTSKIVIEL